MSSPAKTWTVVCFTADESVEAVPTKWINGDDCLWPAVTRDKLNSHIRKCDFNSCWPSHKVRTFRNATYDDYTTARSKACKAEDTSDLNTDDADPFKKTEELGKRIRKKKILSSSESSEEDEPSGVIAKKRQSKIQKISVPPPWIEEKNAENINENELECQPITTFSNNIHSTDSPKSALQMIGTNLKNPDKTERTNRGCCCNPHLLYNIQSLLIDINTKIDKCNYAKNEKIAVPLNVLEKSKLNFPIDSCDQLRIFENFLGSAENYSALVLLFANMGGINLYEFVRRCIAPIIADTLCEQFSFMGKKGKQSFKDTCIAKAIAEAAQRSGHSDNYKKTELRIGDWLRRAKERRLRLVNKTVTN